MSFRTGSGSRVLGEFGVIIRRAMRRHCHLLLATTLLTLPLVAQEFYVTRPYQQWTKPETEKMLHDSPWAQHVTLSRVVMTGVSTGMRGVTGTGNQAAVQDAQHSELPQLTYTAQIRSAMPMRQAVVRQRQIAESYDAKKPDQRAALDAKTSAYLARPQEDIAIFVAIESNVGNYANQATQYWKRQTYDLVKNSIFLTIGRDRLTPVGFAANNEGFQVNFDRPAEILREGGVTLEFTHPPVGALGSEQVRIEFKLNKMLVNGEPAI